MTSLETNATFLVPLITALEGNLRDTSRQQALIEFLAELAYPTSVDGGLFKKASVIRPILNRLSTGAAVQLPERTQLSRFFPGLFRLLTRVPSFASGFPSFFFPGF